MAVARLVEAGERVLCCSGPGVVEEVTARGARVVDEGPCDAVIVGFHTDFDYDRLRRASLAVRAGARLLASNDDATYPTPTGLWPGGGALLAAVETASGQRAAVAGKPHEPVAALVRERLGADGIVVGDRADTDGAFAVTLGYRFGLVLSGVTTEADLPVDPEPAVVAADLAELVRRGLTRRLIRCVEGGALTNGVVEGRSRRWCPRTRLLDVGRRTPCGGRARSIGSAGRRSLRRRNRPHEQPTPPGSSDR